jgi:hypothetical protein
MLRFVNVVRRIPRGVMAGFAIVVIGGGLVATSDVSVGAVGVALMSIGFGLAIISLTRRGFQTAEAAVTAGRRSAWSMRLFGPRLTIGAVFGGLLILFGLMILAFAARLI